MNLVRINGEVFEIVHGNSCGECSLQGECNLDTHLLCSSCSSQPHYLKHFNDYD